MLLEERDIERRIREDYRAGQIAAMLANIHRKENTPAMKVSQFMLGFQVPPEKPQSLESMFMFLSSISSNASELPSVKDLSNGNR